MLIVGGGSAGAVLAARLSERPELRVTLLEAGAVHPADSFPPVLMAAATPGGDASTVWEPPGPDRQRTGHADSVVRAKVLGGGSAINVGVAMRALPSDFRRWTERGLKGWSYPDVLPYYRKLETAAGGADELHGRGGPVPINPAPARLATPMHRAFLAACAARSFPAVDDFNGATPEGAGYYPMNVVDGVRQSTGLVYLTSAVRARPNLRILGDVTVDRVLIENGRATGVRTVDGQTYHAGEIILSAGAAGSAEILLRTGIGPAADLAELGIPVVADLPVGAAVREHPCAYVLLSAAPDLVTTPPVGGLLWTSSSAAGPGEPDLHIAASHLVRPEAFPGGSGFGLLVALARPRARGRLRLRSADPAVPAQLDLNLLGDPRDVRTMLEAVRIARELTATAPLRDLILAEVAPGPGAESDDELAAYLRANVKPYPHLSGTAPMGLVTDPDAVLDENGRVHGLAGLRVVDASMFPDLPSVATNPTVMMAAELIADRFDRP